MRRNEKIDSTSKPNKNVCIVLSVLFAAFTFCFIYILQTDVMSYTQHVLSNGITTYNRFIGSVVVLIISFIIQYAVTHVTRLPANVYALTYLPSAVFLAIITDLIVDYSNIRLMIYVGVLVAMTLYFIIANINLKKQWNDKSDKSSFFMSNILILTFIMIGVGLTSNSNDVKHYDLKIQRLLNEHKYVEALKVGEKSLATNGQITCLRAYALSRTGNLGERLFEYPVKATENSLLLPREDSVYMIFHPDNIYRYLGAYHSGKSTTYNFLHLLSTHPDLLESHPQIKDYLLTSLLVNKKLDLFASEIKQLYDFSNKTLILPKHYKEALALYSHLRTTPVIKFTDSLTESNLRDFNELQKKYENHIMSANALRRQYGDTYWWFYHYN